MGTDAVESLLHTLPPGGWEADQKNCPATKEGAGLLEEAEAAVGN